MDLCRNIACSLLHASIFHPCQYLYSKISFRVTLLSTLIWPPSHYTTQTALARVIDILLIEKSSGSFYPLSL